MTTQVSGDLRVITSTPAKITSVDVRSTTTRPSGDGLMLGQWVTLSKPGEFNAASSEVDFPAVPGPAQIKLFSGGSTVGSVALIVPDTPTATLADCVRNAEMAGDRDVGELAGILEQIRGSVGAAAESRSGAEAAAVDAAGSAASAGRDAGRAEVAAGEAEGSAEAAGTSEENSLDASAAAVAAAKVLVEWEAPDGAGTVQPGPDSPVVDLLWDRIDTNIFEHGEEAKASAREAVQARNDAVTAAESAAEDAGAAGESEKSAAGAASRASSSAAEALTSKESAERDAGRAAEYRSGAEEAKNGAVTAAEDAAESSGSAAASAQDAAGDADRAETAANLVGTAAKLEEWTSQAVGAAQDATSEAGRAAEEADRAAGAAAAEVEKLKGDAPEAFDTLEEIAKELGRNESERAALANAIAGKADRGHTHPLDQVDGLADELDGKADKGHTHTSGHISDATGTGGEGSFGKVVKWNSSGEILRPGGDRPAHWESLVNRRYVDNEVAKKADKGHTHTAAEVGAATPGYVDSRIQLVTAWPASPTPGVLYLMEE